MSQSDNRSISDHQSIADSQVSLLSTASTASSSPTMLDEKSNNQMCNNDDSSPPSFADVLKKQPRLAKVHRAVQALAQCQLIMGLVCCSLGALYIIKQGYFWARVSFGIADGFYFMLTGLIGICGSLTYRKTLLIAYMIMSVHSTLLFAPALIGFSVVAMLLDQQGCSFQCDIFGTKVCRLLCQDTTQWDWTPNESGRTVDIGLIVTACFELLLALSSAILYCKGVREAFSLVDAGSLKNVVKITSTSAATDVKPIFKPLLQVA